MFLPNKLKIDCDERKNRFEVLTDLVGSYFIHMDGEKRHSRLSDTIFWGGMNLIAHDSLISGKKHPEHLVPLAYLFDECFKLIGQNLVDCHYSGVERRKKQWEKEGVRDSIRKILIQNLVVVEIPKEIAKKIDSKELSLKSSMPDRWCFGQSVLERLRSFYEEAQLAQLEEIYREYIEEYGLL